MYKEVKNEVNQSKAADSNNHKAKNKQEDINNNEFIEELSDLVIAIGKGDVSKVDEFFKNGRDTAKYSDEIITFAISKGHKDIVEYLLNKILVVRK